MVAPSAGADDRALPGLADGALRAVLLLTLALLGFSWWLLEGYQIADSVEYMERAQAFVRATVVIDNQQIRSFGFSGLLVPLFWLADRLGVEDFRPVVALVRLLQMALGLALVHRTARIGARLGGRATGLGAALLVGVNPTFLQFAVSPLADVAAALCVAMAVERLLAPTDRRGGLAAGLWLGAALLMAYKTIPIAGLLALGVLARDRRRAGPALAGLTGGYALALALQVALDRVAYGEWGASLVGYFGENAVGVAIRVLAHLGLRDWGESLARWYYALESSQIESDQPLRALQPPGWYWTHLPQMLVWPVAAVGVVALVRCLVQASWRSTLLLAVVVGDVFLLCQKGSKEFRLWLPLLPLLGPLLGWGLAWIAGPRGTTGGRPTWRAGLAAALLVAGTVLGATTLTARNTRRHAGFWRAMELVGERALPGAAGEPVRAACSYHWAVFLRERPGILLEKLPHQMDGWTLLTDEQRYYVLERLKVQDWLIVHLPVLTTVGHEMLTNAINAWFQVEAVLWDPQVYEDIGPVFVLRRRAVPGPEAPFDPGERTLFDVTEDGDLEALRARHGFGEPVRLVRPDLGEELWFLGSTYEVLPGDGHGWLTCYYHARSPFQADYSLLERLTSHDERRAWQNEHRGAWGVHPTTRWQPGWIVRESWPVVAAEEPFRWREPYRPIGGAYRRGDYIPAFLWFDAVTFFLRCRHCGEPIFPEPDHVCGGVIRNETDGEKAISGRMERSPFDALTPLVGPLERERAGAERGWRWSPDGLKLVDRFLLPVHPWARLPDDGRPVAD